MPDYCVVPQCNNKGGHSFPSDRELRLKWCVAIKRGNESDVNKLWTPGKRSVVCQRHFRACDYRDPGLLGEKKRLKPGVVPSIFPFKECPPELNRSIDERDERATKRRKLAETTPDIEIIQHEEVVSSLNSRPSSPVQPDTQIDCGIQCDLMTDANSRCSIRQLQTNDKAIQYFTGFENFVHFNFVFALLGPAAYNLQERATNLSPEDQFFLTVMKLRQAKEDLELAFMFKISESAVSAIVNTWINFIYFQFKEINLWPSKDLIQEYMPVNFGKRFPSTRVVLDATEIPIQKPTNVESQSATFSTYKNKNTLKSMIGITPRGTVSFVSDCYGGSTSDRQIIERSELVSKSPCMFETGDSIMADRGIMVQDLFAELDVKVNIPTFLKGKSQLEPQQVVHDRRIASKRIHVERVIGLAKTYKILQHPLVSTKVPLGSRIVYICFMFCNLRPSIVGKLA